MLASCQEVDQQKIYGFGAGAGALTLLHEAVLDKRIIELALDRMLVSYHSVVTHRMQASDAYRAARLTLGGSLPHTPQSEIGV